MDTWWLNHEDSGTRSVGISFMCEASGFHKLCVVKETWDGSNPGNVSGADMCKALMHTWCDHYTKP